MKQEATGGNAVMTGYVNENDIILNPMIKVKFKSVAKVLSNNIIGYK